MIPVTRPVTNQRGQPEGDPGLSPLIGGLLLLLTGSESDLPGAGLCSARQVCRLDCRLVFLGWALRHLHRKEQAIAVPQKESAPRKAPAHPA